MEIRAWSDAYLPRIFYPRRNSAAFLFPFIPTDKRFFNVTIRARNERIPSFFLFARVVNMESLRFETEVCFASPSRINR